MSDNELILEALNRLYESQNAMNERLTKVLDDHEQRLRASEKVILATRTVGKLVLSLAGFVLTFFGWETLKTHLR